MKNLLIKHFALLLTFGMLIVLNSCSDDDEGDSSSNPLIGTWIWTQDIFSDCEDSANNGTEEIPCNDDTCFSYTFAADGNVTITDVFGGDEDVTTATYAIDGSNVTFSASGISITYGFTVSGNTLRLQLDDFDGCTNVEVYTKQ